MDKNEIISKVSAAPSYSERGDKDWDAACHYRGVDHKRKDQIEGLINYYVESLSYDVDNIGFFWQADLTAEQNLAELKERQTAQTDRVARWRDKLACCVKELELREKGLVTRTIHGTAYYIDYVNGLDTNTGLSIAQSWKTITKYTTTTVRTAGDIAYLRANTTWLQGTQAVDIVFDEDGDVDDYIKIIGCDATTNDPWNDDSNVKPIVDFEDAAYQMYLNGDDYWWLERLDIRQSADVFGMIYLYVGNVNFVDCDLSDSVNVPLFRNGGGIATIEECSFSDSGTADGQIYINTSNYGGCLVIKNSDFQAGALRPSGYAIRIDSTNLIYLQDCTLGNTIAFGTAVFRLRYSSQVLMRNCIYGGTLSSQDYTGSVIYLEDADGTFEAHESYYYHGSIIRATASPRSGGASSYATMTPNANCGPNAPLILGSPMSGFARYWATASQQINISVYARVGSAWDSALTASEAYAKFSYLSNAGTAARTEVNSTQTIANDTTWTAFTSGNITPLRTGWVYIWFYLAEFEDATEYVDVDIAPVVT